MVNFKRLIRFEGPSGNIHYGEVPEGHYWQQPLVGIVARTYQGGRPWEAGFTLTEKTAKVVKVLSPVDSAAMIYGIGLNYRQHAEEAKFPLPPYPLVFVKGAGPAALSGPNDDIPIPKEAELLDYEGELAIVFAKEAKDLTESDNVYDFLLGYTIGNDVSSRYWQDPVRAGGQHGYAKAFDGFSPIGPVLCSVTQITDPSKLTLKTTVNGEQRQLTKTDDLIFDVPSIVRHLTRGRTVYPGTVVMTGTPSGVAAFMKPQAWLQSGDMVEVEISEIGKISNKMGFL